MILVTGAAGFIGFHLCQRLLSEGRQVVGLDSLNQYYEPALKLARLEILKKFPAFEFHQLDLIDLPSLTHLFQSMKFKKVVNLAAQAGVRYSLENPFAYQKSNLEGFQNIIELCRRHEVEGLIYASSSSVYGKNKKTPFAESDPVDHPISLYAATKRSNELVAHTYNHLFGLHVTGLRFFTVYGPYGRPDMALFIFTKAILEGRPIEVYNHGNMYRDFTFVQDIVQGICLSMEKNYPCEVFNLGNNKMVHLTYFIDCIEKLLGRKAQRINKPLQPGDVEKTCADLEHSSKLLGYDPEISIEEGISRFVAWYLEYYKNKQN